MNEVWIYSLISVFLVSLIAFIGLLTISIKEKKLEKIVLYLVSFAAGGLLGGAFIHLIPEAVEEVGFGINVSLYILAGIVVSFIIEKFIWRHCHKNKCPIHSFAYMNLIGDGVHNFIDGLIIGAAYLASIPIGIATTLAVILHEIPQEIGDFGVLIHGGFSRKKALSFNFLTALTAVLGTITSLLISAYMENITNFLIPFAAGAFIYIAGSDLIPELKKEIKIKKSLIQAILLVLGISVMFLLTLLEV
jgi:zinc and cadmium transporter